MKVLALRGCNLASLGQAFEIDFRREPLLSCGVYAISGPTGAGKTTLLDALCLALYHQTPRLSTSNAALVPDPPHEPLRSDDVRQLLRRGAHSAYAEVEFRGQDGFEWRARWEVRRARNRPDGRLQAAEASLIEIASGERVGRTIGEVRKEIIHRIGLDFAQFTRAVLLAQGEFAAFLKAGVDERAQLLEALTGTEHFTRLSIAAHARARQEQQALLLLEAGLVGEPQLQAPARAALQAELECLDQQLRELQQHLLDARVEAAHSARQEQAQIREAQAARQLQDAEDACAAARPRAETLAQWELGARARTLLQARAQAQAELTRLRQQQAGLTQGLVSATQAQQAALLRRDEALTRQFETEQARQLAQPQLEQARRLDLELAAANARLQTLQSNAAEAAEALADAQARQQQASQQLARSSATAAELAGWLQQHAATVDLVREFAAIELRLQQLLQLDLELPVITRRQAELHTQQQQLDQARHAAEVQLAGLQQEQAELVRRSETTLHKLNELSPTALAQGLEQWHQLRQRIQELQAALLQENQLGERHAAAELELAGLSQQLAATALKQQELQPQLPVLLALVEHSQRQWQLARDSSEERTLLLRAGLKSGEPCPVCGSLTHPWTEAAPELPILEQLARARDDARAALDKQQQVLAQVAAAHGAAQTRELQLQQEVRQLARLLQQAEHQRKELGVSFGELIPLEAEALESWLRQRETQLQNEGALLRTRQARQLELQAQERAQQASQRELQQQLQQVHQRLEVLHRESAGLQSQSAALLAQQQAKTQQRDQLMQPLLDLPWWAQFHPSWAADPPLALDQLRQQVRHCQQRQQLAAHHDQQVRAATVQLQQTSADLDRLAPLALAAEAQLAEARLACARLRQARQLCLAAHDVEAYANSLEQAGRQASSALAQASAALAECEAQLQQQRSAEHELHSLVTAAAQSLEAASQRLQAWCEAESAVPVATTELEAWAEVADHERQGLRLELQELEQLRLQRVAQLSRAREELAASTAALRQARPAAELVILIEQLQAREAGQREQRGRILQQLEADADREQQRQLALAQLETQRAQMRVWAQLAELIGSADGKKLRVLAQQHTLGLVLAYANQHLAELAPRFTLQAEGLGLLVIDSELADTSRGVNSLSGGESFLVSLALALGLASLTAQRVRVESLFIDEGFGALDQDTLRIAMEALDRLQAHGRKVGVISHINEMTDRIGTRIRIRRLGHGRSVVEVPGT